MTTPIVIENTAPVRDRLARIIAETCRCEAAPLKDDVPFATVIEQFDSLAMLEILLAIEAEFGLDSETMMRREEMETVNVEELFPENLSGLIHLMQAVAARPREEPVRKAVSETVPAEAENQ
ncbi:phosphopantetheine-binding protein [Pseudomonas sp. S 311-6]|uniref:acyl carrier protein n=1 Tax=Kerstersia gyiorum TaxID=206506 RepID=UPI002096CA28|nr:acyl carrier protein [Kerstersia gyiorum]MCO7641101.1 phosphopantetheine-binding protein [Pseudomonas sp. S 311-6]MCR4160413.1 phosphopantetheine-binding protein [Kerstersia gyiorum]